MWRQQKNQKQEFCFPELPDAPDFISDPPKHTLAEMIKLSEKMLVHWNKIRYSKPEPEFIGKAFEL